MNILTQPNFDLEISQARDAIDRLTLEHEDLTLAAISGDPDARKKLTALERSLSETLDKKQSWERAKAAHVRQEAEKLTKSKAAFRKSQLVTCGRHLNQIAVVASEVEAAASALDKAYRKLHQQCDDARKSCPADAGEVIEFEDLSAQNIRRLTGGQMWRLASGPHTGGTADWDGLALPGAEPALFEQTDNPTFGKPLSEHLAATAAQVTAVIKTRLERLK